MENFAPKIEEKSKKIKKELKDMEDVNKLIYDGKNAYDS